MCALCRQAFHLSVLSALGLWCEGQVAASLRLGGRRWLLFNHHRTAYAGMAHFGCRDLGRALGVIEERLLSTQRTPGSCASDHNLRVRPGVVSSHWLRL